MIFIYAFLVVCGAIALLWPHPPSERERKAALDDAKIAYVRARTEQVQDQTQGIISRYRLTNENRINAMLRQQRQEIEILKLQLQVLEKQRELNITPDQQFKPSDYEEK